MRGNKEGVSLVDPAADPIDQAWQQVEDHWQDPQAHAAFLALCVELGRMPEAGRRYREVRDHDPERSDEARRRIDELLSLATQSLQLARTRTPPAAQHKRLFWVALGVSISMVLFALWTILGPR